MEHALTAFIGFRSKYIFQSKINFKSSFEFIVMFSKNLSGHTGWVVKALKRSPWTLSRRTIEHWGSMQLSCARTLQQVYRHDIHNPSSFCEIVPDEIDINWPFFIFGHVGRVLRPISFWYAWCSWCPWELIPWGWSQSNTSWCWMVGVIAM